MNKYDDGWTYLDKRYISFFYEIRKHKLQGFNHPYLAPIWGLSSGEVAR